VFFFFFFFFEGQNEGFWVFFFERNVKVQEVFLDLTLIIEEEQQNIVH